MYNKKKLSFFRRFFRQERASTTIEKELDRRLKEATSSLDEKAHRLSAFSAIARAMNETHHLDDLMRMVLGITISELDADTGSVMLYERGVDELFIHTGRGLSPEGFRNNRFRLGEGIAGWVAENRTPVLITDKSADPRYLQGRNKKPEKNSLVSVPLVNGKSEVLGVINLEKYGHRPPFTNPELDFLLAIAAQAAVAIENARLIGDLEKSYFDTISALANAVEAKDPYTLGHSDRVTQYAIAIGEEMGLSRDELQSLRFGAVLHDLGKIGVADAVLQKPGGLSDEEFELMKAHTTIGEKIIEEIDFLKDVSRIVRSHQEHYDGSGYPDGLKGDEIPLSVAIVTLADNLDALSTDRPYRPASSMDVAISMIKADSGRLYNPKVVESFLKIFGEQIDIQSAA
ncbi:MAG TPA: HD domain-containing phosphohydrolase [Nitrospirota bacterium]